MEIASGLFGNRQHVTSAVHENSTAILEGIDGGIPADVVADYVAGVGQKCMSYLRVHAHCLFPSDLDPKN
jgi:hypothetical protein